MHYISAETREEGGTRCQRALAAEGDRSAEEIGQQEVTKTFGGCPKRVVLEQWKKEAGTGEHVNTLIINKQMLHASFCL